jgi:predicted membrane-bound mannosyltransferase
LKDSKPELALEVASPAEHPLPAPPLPEATSRSSHGGFSRARLVGWLPFWAVILLGAILRFVDLGAKPLHFDESEHAYFSLGLLHNLQHWGWCVGLNNPPAGYSCYQYDPLLHGPFQFHALALVYQVSQWLGAPDHGVNTTTVRIAAALLGTVLVGLPYFLHDYLGKIGSWLACFLLAISPSMVYFSHFAREDIYMACFTLLMVVAVARYIRERRMHWLVLAAAGFALSYATSEATFLTIAVFGSFLGGLIVWEIGSKFPLRTSAAQSSGAVLRWRSFALLTVGAYVLLLAILAKVGLGILDQLSAYINSHTVIADQNLRNLEMITVRVVPWLGILLGLYVFSILLREMYGKLPPPGRRGLARFVDRRQPVLDTILTMPWTHWFFALMVAFAIFLFLFSVVFTNIAGGIGDGIWRGLYYWLEQQQVQRGGQPWYYYLLLIPLYEQIGVVFGIAGIVRSLLRPNPFRLFLIYWFLGNLFIYSWAGEKMPWLMIFMTLPMLLLAAVALEPCVQICSRFLKERFGRGAQQTSADSISDPIPSALRTSRPRAAAGCSGVLLAILLLIPTTQNMIQVSYVHPADGPHEMMVYVQTPDDINTVMERIEQVDQKDFGGKHQVTIGVTTDATWPFAWYLRDYPNVCFDFPTSCPGWKTTAAIILSSNDNNDPSEDINTYAPTGSAYLYHVYDLRTWWDEGYKLPPCAPNQKPSSSCADPALGSGVGPLLWLSYGDSPPPGAQFNPGLALQHIWNWWWHRQPFGSTGGAYYMVLFIHDTLGVNPA